MSKTAHLDEAVEVTFDKPRRLLFDFAALRALDRAMGEVGIREVLSKLMAMNFQTLERVLWAGMLHEEPNLTLNLTAKRLEKFANNGGDTVELFRAGYQGVNNSKIFGQSKNGDGDDEGNAQPEADAT